jgi:hypothetical protein
MNESQRKCKVWNPYVFPEISAHRRYVLSQLVILENNISCFAITATCFDLNRPFSGYYIKIYVEEIY